MTISRTLRTRLRRYALFCLITATTAGFVDHSNDLHAGDTHDSSELTCRDTQTADAGNAALSPQDWCGWVEDEPQLVCSKQVTADRKELAEHASRCKQAGKTFLTDDPRLAKDGSLEISAAEAAPAEAAPAETSIAEAAPAETSIAEAAPAEISTAESICIIDTCNYDDMLADADADSSEGWEIEAAPASLAKTTSRTSTGFNSTIAAIAAAATAGNPIRFTEWTEPFAMIGPAGSNTPAELEAFQAWFDQSKQVLADFVPVVDFDGQIAPAAETDHPVATSEAKSVDDPLVGGSVFIATIETAGEEYAPYDLAEADRQPDPEPGIEESPLQVEVGIAAVADTGPDVSDTAKTENAVADVVAADVDEVTGSVAAEEPQHEPSERTDDADQVDPATTEKLVWVDGLFSPSHQPFCIRSLAVMRPSGWSPLAKNVAHQPAALAADLPAAPKASEVIESQADEQLAETPDSVDAPLAVAGDDFTSPECLLDELVWNLNVALEDDRVTDQWLRPAGIGNRVASLVVSGDQLASRMASELALIWPAAAPPAKPIPGVGAKLLARAEAAERLPEEGVAKPFTPEQLARADAMFWQWVDVTQRVLEDVKHRLTDVTEVARNRGTQDDSTRR